MLFSFFKHIFFLVKKTLSLCLGIFSSYQLASVTKAFFSDKKLLSVVEFFIVTEFFLSKRKRIQGLLNKHLRHSLINYLLLCEQIFLASPRPNGLSWCFGS